MNTNNFKFLPTLLTFLTLFSLNSCLKNGCTDIDAINFDSYAEKNDGSCTYEGRVVFWHNAATSDSLYYFGSDFLTYIVDGEVVGTQDINTYWTGAPDCGQSGSITVTKDLGSDRTKSFTYSVVDDLGDELWGGELIFNANTCWGHELVW
jgi:hypothetical protein